MSLKSLLTKITGKSKIDEIKCSNCGLVFETTQKIRGGEFCECPRCKCEFIIDEDYLKKM